MQLLLSLVFMIAVSCSSGDTQSQLKKIDEMLNKGYGLTAEQTASVNTFVAQGKSLIEKGKQEEASEALDKALDILKIAEDSYIFNKAD